MRLFEGARTVDGFRQSQLVAAIFGGALTLCTFTTDSLGADAYLCTTAPRKGESGSLGAVLLQVGEASVLDPGSKESLDTFKWDHGVDLAFARSGSVPIQVFGVQGTTGAPTARLIKREKLTSGGWKYELTSEAGGTLNGAVLHTYAMGMGEPALMFDEGSARLRVRDCKSLAMQEIDRSMLAAIIEYARKHAPPLGALPYQCLHPAVSKSFSSPSSGLVPSAGILKSIWNWVTSRSPSVQPVRVAPQIEIDAEIYLYCKNAYEAAYKISDSGAANACQL